MPRVIAVAGVPGAGKSTLARALAATLADADALHMDDYENMTRLPIDAVAHWFRAGADIDAFDFPRLQADLERRRAGAGRWIVFETQFGRAHRATGALVDFLIWIDTPLDVALARSVRAALARGAGADWLARYLEQYVGTVRELLEMQRARVAPGADLVLDGMQAAETLAALAQREVLRRWP